MISSLALLVSCGEVPSDRELYSQALLGGRTNAEACMQIVAEDLRGDCMTVMARSMITGPPGLSAAKDVCEQISHPMWQEECWFELSDKLRGREALDLCARTGRFEGRCVTHAVPGLLAANGLVYPEGKEDRMVADSLRLVELGAPSLDARHQLEAALTVSSHLVHERCRSQQLVSASECMYAQALMASDELFAQHLCLLLEGDDEKRCNFVVSGSSYAERAACLREGRSVAGGAPAGTALALDVAPFAELVVPTHSWGPGLATADSAAIPTWRLLEVVPEGGLWLAPASTLPPMAYRDRLVLHDSGGQIVEKAVARPTWDGPSWTTSTSGLILALPGKQVPGDEIWSLSDPVAAEAQAKLNFATSGAMSEAEFVRRSAATTPGRFASGLLLPSPAVASWALQVPAGGKLRLGTLLLAAESAPRVPSDGADFRVELVVDDKVEILAERPVVDARRRELCVDLSEWSGQEVLLRLSTHPKATTSSDYVFVAEPRVTAPEALGRRLFLVQVQGLRAANLGPYGAKETDAPFISAWAEGGAAYRLQDIAQARPAPLLAGFSTRLAQAGWVPGAFVQKPFPFIGTWAIVQALPAGASEQLSDASAWRQGRDGADTAVWLELSDLVPPDELRHLFSEHPSFALDPAGAERDAMSPVEALDATLGETFEEAGPEDWVVLFSDEVWMMRGPNIPRQSSSTQARADDLLQLLSTAMEIPPL